MAFRKMGLPVDTPQEVIPMGIPDPELFSPTPLEGLNGKLRVLFVGRLVKEKGIGTLMEALCQLSIPVVLKIIGEGPLSVYIGESASNCPHVELIFEGSASGQEVARAMSWSHIVVVPSEPTSTWEEQWGRVAVEAMLSGRPTLVSDCGELPAIVGDSRMTFPAGDVDSLRWALANLNKERGTLESLGDSMRISAKRFAPDVLAKRILEFWEKTVERRYLLS
jgi:glycosyltransferase involved in cell wall biosynthesis